MGDVFPETTLIPSPAPTRPRPLTFPTEIFAVTGGDGAFFPKGATRTRHLRGGSPEQKEETHSLTRCHDVTDNNVTNALGGSGRDGPSSESAGDGIPGRPEGPAPAVTVAAI